MNLLLSIAKRNAVLHTMEELVGTHAKELLAANAKDLTSFDQNDVAMYDRLKVDDAKVAEMQKALKQLAVQKDPLGVERFAFEHDNGMKVSNRTAPFGTVMIIYESRPDVTIEAAGIAFKSGNKILLKGGKESLNSNLVLVDLWHKVYLALHDCDTSWISYLNYDRIKTQEFLANPAEKLDLIVPRGGERLIAFVKQHATCPVIVSGRGNNFLFVDKEADKQMAIDLIINAKTAKISACNALDKVLIDSALEGKEDFVSTLIAQLKTKEVSIHTDDKLAAPSTETITDDAIWYEDF